MNFSLPKEKDAKAKFKYEDEVQKWLDLIRGAFWKQQLII